LPDSVAWGGVRYLAVTFSPSECDVEKSVIKLAHKGIDELSTSDGTVFDRLFDVIFDDVQRTDQTARILFPAYCGYSINFDGIIMDREMSSCLTDIAEAPRGDNPPITPYIVLNPGWQYEPAYLKSH
jgi:hypothetical protein